MEHSSIFRELTSVFLALMMLGIQKSNVGNHETNNSPNYSSRSIAIEEVLCHRLVALSQATVPGGLPRKTLCADSDATQALHKAQQQPLQVRSLL